jgi:hypothetical protein
MLQTATNCQLAGRYRLCRWLAAGGMGQVWQAVDQVLDRPVAVKLLRDEYAQDRSFISRFRAEAHHAAAVCRPGIASAFDYGQATTSDGAAPTASWSWSWLTVSRCRRCWLGRAAWGWYGAWTSSDRPPWLLGRRIGQGWCTATSSQPTC